MGFYNKGRCRPATQYGPSSSLSSVCLFCAMISIGCCCCLQEEKKQRLGPGGVDPVEILETLPPVSKKSPFASFSSVLLSAQSSYVDLAFVCMLGLKLPHYNSYSKQYLCLWCVCVV